MADDSKSALDTIIKLVGAFAALLASVTGGTWAGVKLGVSSVEATAAADRSRIVIVEMQIQSQGAQLTRIEAAVATTNSNVDKLFRTINIARIAGEKGKPHHAEDSYDLGDELGGLGGASVRRTPE